VLEPATREFACPGADVYVLMTIPWTKEAEAVVLTIHMLQPGVALIAGVLILLAPRLLSFIVAIYLIITGAIGLWPEFLLHLR
jgi:Protein of unknown function (DUF3096)